MPEQAHQQQPQLIQTGDGSHSLYNPALDETYHSHHGALQESQYVFIRMGLDAWRAKQPHAESLSVLEIGFGTGLNALLALHWALQHKVKVHFTTLEPYPVSLETAKQLNYPQLTEGEKDFLRLHEAPWEEDVLLYDYFILHKKKQKLEEAALAEAAFDVVFFDAFAPNKQPELWEKALLEKTIRFMAPAALLTTYCAKGQLKRDLRDAGLQVETLPGAPGKKEMVRGSKA
ncbi:tRNA (5-methylaminomethyl-2-thiouridine)(34)-methyltransferase MnmD [Cesiribacter sp. SM1]|uniref:tRNA (5-methylaminomethyl-2-thiouridine)(34)-methyltransferase MnmD n=1 Tax=Cesiribacter sp. SM1 TaxID=2861196 RepID=UPI001CD498A5|nr:tRNA (5-methylaminomethyl-2-thiouridine)(34)-methyltransferase MnmD [Cesiribacter sp. SM1]